MHDDPYGDYWLIAARRLAEDTWTISFLTAAATYLSVAYVGGLAISAGLICHALAALAAVGARVAVNGAVMHWLAESFYRRVNAGLLPVPQPTSEERDLDILYGRIAWLLLLGGLPWALVEHGAPGILEGASLACSSLALLIAGLNYSGAATLWDPVLERPAEGYRCTRLLISMAAVPASAYLASVFWL